MTSVARYMASVTGGRYAERERMHVGRPQGGVVLSRGVHVHRTRDRRGRTRVIGKVAELDVSVHVGLVCGIVRRVATALEVILPASGCGGKLWEVPVDVLITQYPHETPVSGRAYGATRRVLDESSSRGSSGGGGRSEERALSFVVALETVQEREEDRVWGVGSGVLEVYPREL